MATAGTTLIMKFGTTHGDKKWTFKYAKENINSSAISTVAQAMIDNGSIYQNQPLSFMGAEIVKTTVTTYTP